MSERRRRIVYAGYFRFPEGNAAAARVLAIGKALRDSGHEVLFAGAQNEPRSQDRAEDGRCYYQGFEYQSMRETAPEGASRLSRAMCYAGAGRNTARWLGGRDPSSIVAVVIYNALTAYAGRIHQFCRRHDIPLVLDLTEWYEAPKQWRLKSLVRKLDIDWTMQVLNVRARNVIAISSKLADFYRERGLNTIRIPPLVDLDEPRWAATALASASNRPVRFVYAGRTFARKDSVGNLLAAFARLRQRGADAVLELCGLPREEVAASGPQAPEHIRELGNHLVIHGHLPTPADATRVMQSADVLLLVKEPGPLAEAQFPTKLVEYLAVGRPVLLNLTSDIEHYVRDGEQAFVIPDNSPEAIVAGVTSALERRADLPRMALASRACAEAFFDYRQHVEGLASFFNSLEPIRPR